MILASKAQLQVAFDQGYALCACGWLSDKTAFYPTQVAGKGCGGRGLNRCGNDPKKGYDVFCYSNGAKGNFYDTQTNIDKH